MAPREAILGLDKLERGISFFAGGIALVSALFFIPHLLHNTTIIQQQAPGKNDSCPSGYHYVKAVKECHKALLTHPSYWVLQFLEIVVIGLLILVFAFLKKRAGVIVTALLLGLASGTAGILYIFLGGWLSLRAYRLQRYGDPTMVGSGRIAREMGRARKEGRDYVPPTAPAGSASATAKPAPSGPPTPPGASKRYTPKQTRKRR